ncbi:MAG: glycosyltransferase family 4 protein [Bacteroidetes bacterium]|nr:glycosyltransferase family 4 protein [Bacteroidota bacterium]
MAGRIGFDAKRAFYNKSGLGNYARTLISSLIKYHPEFNYLLFSPKNNRENLFPIADGQAKLIAPEKQFHQKFPSLWRSYFITENIRNEKLNIFHGLSNELPANINNTGLAKIVTIHDLIFLSHPKLYPYFDRKVYNLKFRKSCQSADIVIAISESTKLGLMDYYKIPEAKIRVAYQSCHPSYFSFLPEKEKEEMVKKKFMLPRQFMLYVGTIEERKNLLSIIKAMALLPASIRIPLVIVGGKRDAYFNQVKEFIIKNNLQDLIIIPSNVDDEALKYFYKLASLFIYPSVFEGFGLPALEALLMETPVITSSTSSLPEAAGPNSCLLQNPTDALEMAAAIESLLQSEEKRKTMSRFGLDWAQQFHPEKTSTNVASIYKEFL